VNREFYDLTVKYSCVNTLCWFHWPTCVRRLNTMSDGMQKSHLRRKLETVHIHTIMR